MKLIAEAKKSFKDGLVVFGILAVTVFVLALVFAGVAWEILKVVAAAKYIFG